MESRMFFEFLNGFESAIKYNESSITTDRVILGILGKPNPGLPEHHPDILDKHTDPKKSALW